jgi:glycosyltransferase involved in cell wall biosynthesis
VLHPAAHDEAVLHLPAFDEVLTAPGGLVFHSEAEKRVVEARCPAAAARPQIVLGLGVDGPEVAVAGRDPLVDEAAARAALGLGERPYLVCVGRVEATKGTTLLVELFARYKRQRPGPLALVLVGPLGVEEPPPAHPDVVLAGRVDDATKWALLRGAAAFVSPSAYESFSFVVLEAWLAGTPVLVNAWCDVTREHCRRSGGGLWFRRYGDWEVALDRVLADADLRAALAERGRTYAERFAWPVVIDRYVRFLDGL